MVTENRMERPAFQAGVVLEVLLFFLIWFVLQELGVIQMQMQMMYDLDVSDVIRAENGPLTGDQLRDIAEHHYSENPHKLAAHYMAASVINETGHDVSARFLIWLARQESLIGPKAMHELVDIYAGVHTNSEDTFSERNSNSAWLTRFLEAKGCSVTKAKSKMDSE